MQAFLRSIDHAFEETGDLDVSDALTKIADSVKRIRSTVDSAIGALLFQQVSKCMTDMHAALTPKKKNNGLEYEEEDEDDVMELMDTDEEGYGSVATGAREWLQGRLLSHDMPADVALLRAAVLYPGKRAVDAAAALQQLDCAQVLPFLFSSFCCQKEVLLGLFSGDGIEEIAN